MQLLKAEDRQLLKANVPIIAFSSLVSANTLTRGDSGNVYIPNWDVPVFNNKVSVDIDMYAFTRVSNNNFSSKSIQVYLAIRYLRNSLFR